MAGQTPLEFLSLEFLSVTHSYTFTSPYLQGMDEWLQGMGLCGALQSEQAQVAFVIIYLG